MCSLAGNFTAFYFIFSEKTNDLCVCVSLKEQATPLDTKALVISFKHWPKACT